MKLFHYHEHSAKILKGILALFMLHLLEDICMIEVDGSVLTETIIVAVNF